MIRPYLIDIKSIGSSEIGYISIAENNRNIPFKIKRVYWTYFTPNNVIRGNHAHKELEQVIVAVSGKINFILEDIEGVKYKFMLDSPDKGLYIPRMYWRTIKFSHNAVLLCMASNLFDEKDYIRKYSKFKQ